MIKSKNLQQGDLSQEDINTNIKNIQEATQEKQRKVMEMMEMIGEAMEGKK